MQSFPAPRSILHGYGQLFDSPCTNNLLQSCAIFLPCQSLMHLVEPTNKGHFGSRHTVLYGEAVLWWEVNKWCHGECPLWEVVLWWEVHYRTLNCITHACEEMFSYIKYYLKDHDKLLNPTSSIQLFRQVLNSAFLSVTESQCKQWISHAGYVVN